MVWSELMAYLGVMLPGRDDYVASAAAVLPMAEQRIYRGEGNCDPLRVQGMLKLAAMANGTRPVDYLSAKRVSTLAGSRTVSLEYCPLDQLSKRQRAFSWAGNTLVLSSDASFSVDLLYYAKLDALVPTDPNSTNMLLTEAPNIYAQAILVELAQGWRDDALAARSAANWVSAQQSYIDQDKRAAYSGSAATAQVHT